MKNSRPFTAYKENRINKIDNKMVLSQIKRPLSAKNDSLKRIIQVIENTLNKGAQTILTKTKTLEKFKKMKNQAPDFTQFRMPKERSKYDRQFPEFRTEYFISSTPEPPKSTTSIKSTKKIFPSFDNEEFVPYMMQEGRLRSQNQDFLKRQRAPMKKITKKVKAEKEIQRQSNTITFKQIDKWENQPSIMNMSNLFDHRIA